MRVLSVLQDLVSQRQKVREERERLQAQLEHFRRCLTLPNIHWGRSQVNGHTPRWPPTPTLWLKRLWQRRISNRKQDRLEPDHSLHSKHLKEPVLVLLRFWPVSYVTWLVSRFNWWPARFATVAVKTTVTVSSGHSHSLSHSAQHCVGETASPSALLQPLLLVLRQL